MATPTFRLRQFVELRNYFVASCCGLLVDVSLLLLLNQRYAVPYLIAASISFISGGIVGYHLCTRFVFVGRGTLRGRPFDLLLFLFLGMVGLAMNTIILAAAVELGHAPLLVAKAAAAGCTFCGNYWMRRRWVFPSALAMIE
jgi:putative flippase GtrA